MHNPYYRLTLDVVRDLLRGTLPSMQGYARCECPSCLAELGYTHGKKNLSINVKSGFYKCWRCGIRGAVRGLGTGVISFQPTPLPQDVVLPPEGYANLGILADIGKYLAAHNYLKSRWVSDDAIRNCKIGAITSGQYPNSVVVPVTDNGVWRGYVVRFLPPRGGYRYPAKMPRGRVVFNQDALWEDTQVPVIVVEGCFDALPHYPNAVAVLGKPTEHHRRLLLQTKRPIAVALDADAQGEGWAFAMSLVLEGHRAGFVKLPPGTDPGEIDPAWLLGAAIDCVEER